MAHKTKYKFYKIEFKVGRLRYNLVLVKGRKLLKPPLQEALKKWHAALCNQAWVTDPDLNKINKPRKDFKDYVVRENVPA